MPVERLTREEIFEYLRPDQVNVLSKASQVLHLKAGETVYHQGTKAIYFYIVLEGEVALRLTGRGKSTILIDLVSAGTMFGSCISFAIDSYVLTAQCTKESEILRIESSVLRNILDEDPRMGYAIQSQISKMYFQRYIETMKKLQAIVMNVPVETE